MLSITTMINIINIHLSDYLSMLQPVPASHDWFLSICNPPWKMVMNVNLYPCRQFLLANIIKLSYPLYGHHHHPTHLQRRRRSSTLMMMMMMMILIVALILQLILLFRIRMTNLLVVKEFQIRLQHSLHHYHHLLWIARMKLGAVGVVIPRTATFRRRLMCALIRNLQQQ